MLEAYDQGGVDALSSLHVPLLSWDEVQSLTGPGTVGLPLGYTPTRQAMMDAGNKMLPATGTQQNEVTAQQPQHAQAAPSDF